MNLCSRTEKIKSVPTTTNTSSSRFHCQIECHGFGPFATWTIQDSGSSTGTGIKRGKTFTRKGKDPTTGEHDSSPFKLKRGDRFGAKDTIVGYECDGCELEWRDGLPFATHQDGTPKSFDISCWAPVQVSPNWADRCELSIRPVPMPLKSGSSACTASRLSSPCTIKRPGYRCIAAPLPASL